MTEDQFETLTRLIGNLSTRIDKNHDDLSVFIKWSHDDLSAEMSTRFEKVDARFDQMDRRFEKVETELSYIRAELRDIRHDLEMLKTKVADQSGFFKEIDYAFTRIAAIEKHLDMAAVEA